MHHLKSLILIITVSYLPEAASGNTSEDARAEKDVIFQGHLGLIPNLAVAGSAGIYVSKNLTLELHGSASTSLDGDTQNLTGTVRTRKFLTNSIYMLLGTGTRSFRRTIETYGDFGNHVTREETFIRDLGIELAFGNSWTISSFTIGLDWFWWYIPVHTVSRVHREYNRNGAAEKNSKTTKGKYAPGILVAPQMNIGFTF